MCRYAARPTPAHFTTPRSALGRAYRGGARHQTRLRVTAQAKAIPTLVALLQSVAAKVNAAQEEARLAQSADAAANNAAADAEPASRGQGLWGIAKSVVGAGASLLGRGDGEAGEAEVVATGHAPDASEALADSPASTAEFAVDHLAVQEPAVAILSELARTQSANRTAIMQAGGLQPIADLVCHGAPGGVQQHATTVLWGLAQESGFRLRIAKIGPLVTRLLELMYSDRTVTPETRKVAAATMVALAQDEMARVQLRKADATADLNMIKHVADSWMRSQAEALLQLLSTSEGGGGSGGGMTSGGGGPVTSVPGVTLPESPRLGMVLRYQHSPRPMLEWSAPLIPMPTVSTGRVRARACMASGQPAGTGRMALSMALADGPTPLSC